MEWLDNVVVKSTGEVGYIYGEKYNLYQVKLDDKLVTYTKEELVPIEEYEDEIVENQIKDIIMERA